jgi:hypothetical protein
MLAAAAQEVMAHQEAAAVAVAGVQLLELQLHPTHQLQEEMLLLFLAQQLFLIVEVRVIRTPHF